MKSIKVFTILDSLSQEELQSFRDFINSPFFNKNPNVVHLFEIYTKYRESAKKPDLKKIAKSIYPSEPYSPGKMADLCYALLKLLKEYIAVSSYQDQPLLKAQHLLESAGKQNNSLLIKDAENEFNKAFSHPMRSSDKSYAKYIYSNLNDKANISSGKIGDKTLLQNKIDSLDIFYLEEKLKGSCEMYNRGKIIQSEFKFSLLEPLLQALKLPENNTLLNTPSIAIYYSILQLFNEDQQGQFDTLMSLVQEHANAFTDDELREIYGYVQNHCIRMINEGQSDYYVRLYRIYLRLIETDLICRDKHINQWDYKNIISLALRLSEHEWTHSFIETFKDKLQEQHRKNAYTYSLANYYYETRNYKNAIKLLQSVEYSDVYYRLDTTSMLLKMYFELEEEDAFYAQASAFKVYLKRNKLISERNYTLYYNLVKLSSALFKMKVRPYYHRNAQFYRRLAELKSKAGTLLVINSKWLLDKISELEASKRASTTSS